MRTNLYFALALLLAFLGPTGRADTVIFTTGEVIQGKVLQTNDTAILVRRDYGTFTYPRDKIKGIEETERLDAKAFASTNQIADWATIIARLAKHSWAYSAKQVPATVIDQGVFKNVPYLSFRCGANYELNIYGDPDKPAGVEMGIYDGLLKDSVAKENCIEFIASVLANAQDREVLKKLKRDEDVATREALIFEVSPPTAVDSYGGWWISAYDEDKLNAVRASATELEDISQPLGSVETDPTFNPNDSRWAKSDLKQARRIVAVSIRNPPAQASARTEIREAPSPASSYLTTSSSPQSLRSSDTSSSGRVFVRSYTRRDGTFVRAHTRSAPRRR